MPIVVHDYKLNGRIPSDDLKLVQKFPRAVLHRNVTNNFREMRDDKLAMTKKSVRVRAYGSYRNLALQRLFHLIPARFHVMHGITQAPTGFSSHGWGDAIDVQSGSLAWMLRYGAAYGWHRTIPGDTYHFVYTGKLIGNKPQRPR